MGIKQAEMVKHRLFRSTLEELRTRHTFLERRGLYQTPDKKGQTVIANPKLDSVLNADLETFLLAHAANASAEEYDVFRRLVAREWKQEERHHGDRQAEMEDSDDDDDEVEEEEDEMEGKESYRKRKKNKVVTHEWENYKEDSIVQSVQSHQNIHTDDVIKHYEGLYYYYYYF